MFSACWRCVAAEFLSVQPDAGLLDLSSIAHFKHSRAVAEVLTPLLSKGFQSSQLQALVR